MSRSRFVPPGFPLRREGHATWRMTIPHENASNRSGLALAHPRDEPNRLPTPETSRYFSGGPYTGSNTVSSLL